MSYLARLKRQISPDASKCEPAKPSKAPSVGSVGSVSAPLRDISAMPDHWQRAAAMLDANPLAKYAALVVDPATDPVIIAVAIRGKAMCDVAIPRDKFDPFVLLEMIHAHRGILQ